MTAQLVMTATAEADPTFDAIEQHRLKLAALAKIDDCWADLPAFEAASAAEAEALDALCSTVPTTIAGARVAIEHVMAVQDGQ